MTLLSQMSETSYWPVFTAFLETTQGHFLTAQPSTEIKRGASKGINESGVHLFLPSGPLFKNTRHAEDQQNTHVRRSVNYMNSK